MGGSRSLQSLHSRVVLRPSPRQKPPPHGGGLCRINKRGTLAGVPCSCRAVQHHPEQSRVIRRAQSVVATAARCLDLIHRVRIEVPLFARAMGLQPCCRQTVLPEILGDRGCRPRIRPLRRIIAGTNQAGQQSQDHLEHIHGDLRSMLFWMPVI